MLTLHFVTNQTVPVCLPTRDFVQVLENVWKATKPLFISVTNLSGGWNSSADLPDL